MPQDLERLLVDLRRAPLDRSLDMVTADVGERLVESAAANEQTWRLRVLSIALVAVSGGVAGAASTATAASHPSPFAAWSTLAPSTLLDPSE